MFIGELRAGMDGLKELVVLHTSSTGKLVEAQGKTLDLLARTTSDNSGQIKVMFQRLEAHETRDANIVTEIKTLKRWASVAAVAGVAAFAVFAPEQVPRAIRFVASLL